MDTDPVRAVRVSLTYVDGSARIIDARDVTNVRGEAFLHVSTDAAQRGDIRLEIAGASAGHLATRRPAIIGSACSINERSRTGSVGTGRLDIITVDFPSKKVFTES
jgi:hypothetical protein